MIDLKRVEIPESVTRNMFNCYEQQVMTICMAYRNEFWKLFLNQDFSYEEDNTGCLKEMYSYKGNFGQSIEGEYGIGMEEGYDPQQIVFDGNGIYMFEIDSRYYEQTRDIDGEGTHNVLVYGETKDSYKVNDNYYGIREQLIKKKELIPGVLRCYKITDLEEKTPDLNKELSAFFKKDVYSHYEKIVESFEEDGENLANDLIEYFTVLYKYFNKVSLVIKNIDNQEYNPFLKACADVVDQHVVNIQNSVYYVVKCVFKDMLLNHEAVKMELTAHSADIRIMQQVMKEVSSILEGKESEAQRIRSQLKKYEEISEVDITCNEDACVYDAHDKLSVLFLLNFLEEENEGINIEYDEIGKLSTYMDFLILAYKKVLENK